MSEVKPRKDDYLKRREHLKDLSDNQLKELFWNLTEEVVDPLLELAREYTSPSIERSILLRMGFSSVQAKEIVEEFVKVDLIAYGVGNVLLVASMKYQTDIFDAAKMLLEGNHWEEIRTIMEDRENECE